MSLGNSLPVVTIQTERSEFEYRQGQTFYSTSLTLAAALIQSPILLYVAPHTAGEK